jgi:hypothetical protein
VFCSCSAFLRSNCPLNLRANGLPALRGECAPLAARKEVFPSSRLLTTTLCSYHRERARASAVFNETRQGPSGLEVNNKQGTETHKAVSVTAKDPNFGKSTICSSGGRLGFPTRFKAMTSEDGDFLPITVFSGILRMISYNLYRLSI